jgi:adenosylmethionine-8-amino-7-oxononanoate aminotransferase
LKFNGIFEMEDDEELVEWGRRHLIHYTGYQPTIIERGEGAVLEDTTGRKYLDLLSGSTSVNIGYGEERVKEAIKEQLKGISTITVSFFSTPVVKVAKLLAEIAPGGLSRSFFSCTGSQATELAMQTARRYTGRMKIISRHGGYHGNTMGSITASGCALHKRVYDPAVHGFVHVLPPYCYRCDFGHEYPGCNLECAKAVENTIVYEWPETVAAVIGEPIIGGGGVVIPPLEYWKEVRRICDKFGVLLILDEVITGFGRTGKMFCSEHYGVVPDIMAIAKGIASCYAPLSGVLTTDEIALAMEDHEKGSYYSTYQNHPLSCAAALSNLKVMIEDGLVERSARLGEYMLKALSDLVMEFDVLDDARGKGLLLGVEVVKDKVSKEPDPELGLKIRRNAYEKGLLVGLSRIRMKDAIINIFGPPLNITKEQIDESLNTYRSAVQESIG